MAVTICFDVMRLGSETTELVARFASKGAAWDLARDMSDDCPMTVISRRGVNDQAAQDLLSLSSGTLAGLFGTAKYSEIDAALAAWHGWVITHPVRLSDWKDAWAAYQAR